MDDLDHSMHIAEFDWSSFYDESEECCVLQASLACLDNLSLSDAEESEKPGQEQQDKQQSDGAEESYLKLLMKLTEGGEDSVTQVDTLSLHEKTAEDVSEETGDIRNTEQTDTECSGVSKEQREEEGDLQTLVDDSRNEHDPPSPPAGLNVNEPLSVAPRAEKERWFVTVNDSPARQRAKAGCVKKKRRQKKLCKDSHSHIKIHKEKRESRGGRGAEGFVQSNHDMVIQRSGGQMINTDSGEEDNVSEVMATSHPPRENTTEPTEDKHGEEPASTSRHTFTPKESKQVEGGESEEAEEGVEFFSSHSYDSENYLSAAESLENYQPVALDAEFPSAGQRANKMPDDDDADSTCDDTTDGAALHLQTHTPQLQEHTPNIPASGGSPGGQLDHLNPDPDSTSTPQSVADDPEAFAKATGRAQPVYAISAFWDEMEKLTINDILQLRMGKSVPPWESQETGTASRDDSPLSQDALIHTAKDNSPDGGLMDASDAADSDYFTQTDESKPDRSSCEFSTSDFEEEYWQFIGASRNPSPDPRFKNLRRTNDSPFSSQEEEEEKEEESTSSEGKETPVPVEDSEGECFEDQELEALTRVAWPSRKIKSMHNVQALLDEDLTLPVSDDISSLLLRKKEDVVLEVADRLETLIPAPFLSIPDILDEHYQISFPKVFEYFFTEDKAKMEPGCVALYGPEDISVAPVFDYPLCTFRNEMSFFSLHDSRCREEEPIPIFSCSPPKLRDLTFPTPNYVFLSADYKAEEDMNCLSPIRVVSRAFIQDGHGTSAGWPRSWSRSFLSMPKIRFYDKGSVWCRSSGAWVFPVQAERTERQDPPVGVLTQGGGSSDPSQMFKELALQQSILGTMQTRRQEGVFSTLKQADMCLVCIAFASWVLRSSDPEAADTWKAALLANVSALSAIQYLRHYVKKTTPDP